ncbi:MAG TPA: hypothetical protein VFP15_05325, partial [Gemmatimonadaceae bacterium]|nr:hypothetical protein [Gemmatimonadaceae bacterium]
MAPPLGRERSAARGKGRPGLAAPACFFATLLLLFVCGAMPRSFNVSPWIGAQRQGAGRAGYI